MTIEAQLDTIDSYTRANLMADYPSLPIDLTGLDPDYIDWVMAKRPDYKPE